MGELHFEEFRQTIIFLVTAGVIVPLSRRLHLSPILGFLLAGMLLGPGLAALTAHFPAARWLSFEKSHEAELLAELGVVFLLFMIGLELSFERLARMRAMVFGLGAGQVFGSIAALGAAAAWAFGLGWQAAFVVGAALSLSSTAIVLPTLAEQRRLRGPAGRASFAVLLFQDLMVAPLLFIVTMLGSRGGGGLGETLLYVVAPAFVALGVLVFFGRLLLRPLFHQVALARSTEFFMAACLLVVIVSSLVTALAGLSMALGAFIAGLLLAETEFRREVEVTIEPFKGLLLGLFFLMTGASLDLGLIASKPLVVFGVALGLVAIKGLVLFPVALLGRMRPGAARDMSLVLAPGGEFAFVMISAGVAKQLLPTDLGAILMVAVTLSMMTIPLLALLAARMPTRSVYRDADLGPAPTAAAGRVIVVGYGRVGQLVGAMLARHDKKFVAIDGDPATVRRARAAGVDTHWGDATRRDFLRRCGMADAAALVVTLDAPKAAEHVVALARKMRPDLVIIARARDAHHATTLYELGATDAIPETIEASLQLSEAVLVDVGVPMGLVIASIHEKRDEFRKQLAPTVGGAPHRAVRVSRRPLGRARGTASPTARPDADATS